MISLACTLVILNSTKPTYKNICMIGCQHGVNLDLDQSQSREAHM